VAISRNYIPQKVPAQASDSIRGFLDNELYLIALLLNETSQARQYGGMSNDSGASLSVTATAQIIPFTTEEPSNGVIPVVASNHLTLTEDGDYVFTFNCNFAASNSIVLEFEIYVNGIASGRTALAEVITQADGSQFNLSRIIRGIAGEQISVFVSGVPNRTVTFENLNLFLTRL